jgi:hypothetical protein
MFRIQLWNDAVEKYVPSLISVVVSTYPILPTNKPKKTYASRKSTTFNLYRCLMMFELKTHGFPWLSMVPARCAVLLVLLSLLLGGAACYIKSFQCAGGDLWKIVTREAAFCGVVAVANLGFSW